MDNINNVKISVLFKSVAPMSHFENLAKIRKVSISHNRNFIVIKDVCSLTVFKKLFDIYHINVTGINSPSIISYAISWLRDHYCISNIFRLIKYTIDNITATFNIGFSLPLLHLAKNLQLSKYNSERFPGLHLKVGKWTAVLFKSGKINILGCKTAEEVSETWNVIKTQIKNVVKTR